MTKKSHILPKPTKKDQPASKILVAFLLNLSFSIFEFFGGILTGSIAITSDAIHDLGDAASIGIAYFLERYSHKAPNDRYTYGYLRYSVMGGLITTLILLTGSIIVIYGAISRIIDPVEINYDGVIILAIVGTVINFAAAWFTHGGHSINQKSVNLHMLEDVLGWVVVLIGAIVMRFTDFYIIDPLLSIAVALFILICSLKNFKAIIDLFLEKTPEGIPIKDLRKHITSIPGVESVHHIHVWSMDGYINYATMHVVCQDSDPAVKVAIRKELKEHNIGHVTIELETVAEHCPSENCHVEPASAQNHHHHH